MAKWPRFDPDADRRLAKVLSEGGDRSLATLYDIYAERLRDYCGSLIHDRRVATDIVHDTLIDARRRIRRMRDRTRLRAWLYGAVRRRCLQRVPHPTVRWEGGAGPADDEVRGLLETAFDRLDFLDQEALLLVLRHDLSGDDLGALLGIPARRANARVARARIRADGALDKARRTVAQRCATGERLWPHEPGEAAEPGGEEAPQEATGPQTTGPQTTGPQTTGPQTTGPQTTGQTTAGHMTVAQGAAKASPASSRFDDAALADHMAGCVGCRRRTELSLATLLDMMPAPPLPASLRHRVIHTGTDPELAGYRTDIAARGGTLNADGLPRQPDIPSQFARRWLFTTGGIVGATLSAIVAAFLIGPGTSFPGLDWPSYRPEPSISPEHPGRRPHVRHPPAVAPRQPGLPGDAAAQDKPPRDPRSSPTPSTPAGGVLAITPDAIDFGRQDTVARLRLASTRGAVTWNASSSSSRLSLSTDSGELSADRDTVLTVTLSRGLLELPGEETITIVDSSGRRQLITVVWAGSLL
jgi:DNA-directed RNA polymerase specialized sigma24 family protein